MALVDFPVEIIANIIRFLGRVSAHNIFSTCTELHSYSQHRYIVPILEEIGRRNGTLYCYGRRSPVSESVYSGPHLHRVTGFSARDVIGNRRGLVMILTEDGQIYVAGSPTHLSGGITDTFVPNPSGHRVVQIATNNYRHYYLTERGEVWAWGLAREELDASHVGATITVPVRVSSPDTPIVKIISTTDRVIMLDYLGYLYRISRISGQISIEMPIQIQYFDDIVAVGKNEMRGITPCGNSVQICTNIAASIDDQTKYTSPKTIIDQDTYITSDNTVLAYNKFPLMDARYLHTGSKVLNTRCDGTVEWWRYYSYFYIHGKEITEELVKGMRCRRAVSTQRHTWFIDGEYAGDAGK